MSVLNENQLMGASGAGGDYEIEQSLRFDDGSTSYLKRTPIAASNRRTWTFSAWIKRGSLPSNVQTIFMASNPSSAGAMIRFNSDKLVLLGYNGGVSYTLATNRLFRDPSAWYHIVLAVDTTQGTAANRLKMYVNGVQETSFSTATYPSQNLETYVNSTNPHYIGVTDESSLQLYFDGYIGEVNFIDGQALTPDSFGETGKYGEWNPIKYAGGYGTNGFYLPFKQDYTVEGFSTVVYEGNGVSGHYIGGTGFKPDLVWMKGRSLAQSHNVYDAIRGANRIRPDVTNAEVAGTITFETDGFTLGTQTETNNNGSTFVAWNWDMGGTTASNTNGSITSSVRANTTYGQSIVSYTGTGSNATVGHGLASAPDMVICRPRNLATHWRVWHEGLTNGTYTLFLNSTGAQQVQSDAFGSLPTSSVFSVAADLNTNTQPYIAYCFHSVTNYSKFGSYSGNGSTTGPVVTTGFSPAFVMIKRTDAVDNWIIMDNTRDPYNPADKWLYPNGSFEEYDGATRELDFLANGFQPKAATTEFNASGGTYIYAAFADTREYAYWYDQSGNNNDWTSEGGLTESDVMLDSPTNNFSTMNPLVTGGGVLTLAEGNLAVSGFGSARQRHSTMMPSSGKWYAEFLCTAAPNDVQIGIANDLGTGYLGNTANSWGIISANGNRINADIQSSYGTSYSTGDIIGVALDLDNGKVFIAENNTYNASGNPVTGSNPMYSSLSGAIGFAVGSNSTLGNVIANFGQDSSFAGNKTPQGNADSGGIGDFFYPVPSGFLALCTANLPSVDVIPSEHFNTVLYTGNDSTNVITGVGFKSDFSWWKKRNAATDHALIDSVRGVTKHLVSNTANAEITANVGTELVSFDSDGFTLGAAAQTNSINGTSASIVAWNWKAGGSAVSNTNGSITSQVSANVDAGFSIVKYVGNNTSGATVGHGLSETPTLMITKNMTNSAYWATHLSSIPNNKYYLNDTSSDSATNWISASSSLITLTQINANNINESGSSYINYCFHSVESYSKVGTYTGNTSSTDGTFVHCGFAPSFLLIKDTGAGNTWVLLDSKRDSINPNDTLLQPQLSAAETTGWAGQVDFLSNGFKIRSNDNALNAARTYLFYAIAENPFKHTNAR